MLNLNSSPAVVMAIAAALLASCNSKPTETVEQTTGTDTVKAEPVSARPAIGAMQVKMALQPGQR